MICPLCSSTAVVIRQGREHCNQCGSREGEAAVPEWRAIPVYIINRNNLDRGFRDLVCWLNKVGMSHIEVLDNDSTYPPLLEYYKECPAIITKIGQNLGPYVFWDTNRQLYSLSPYVVTDSDVVPDKDCPDDLVGKMLEVFQRYRASGCVKVGPGLRIDNLPDHYKAKDAVIRWETQNFNNKNSEGDAYSTSIDTTFALYWSKSNACHPVHLPPHNHYRLAAPYVIEHRPWYADTENLIEEDKYYEAHRGSTSWGHWRRTG